MPNAAEAKALTGATNVQEALCQLAEICQLVVVKDGPGGAYAWREGEILHAPALALAPVDTTGAGDCFNAGFLRAWLEGLPLQECLQWGNIVGGLSTLKRGGTGQVITTRDVEEWLER
jgi:sugar/nucleoside kinase (ribokinase family)